MLSRAARSGSVTPCTAGAAAASRRGGAGTGRTCVSAARITSSRVTRPRAPDPSIWSRIDAVFERELADDRRRTAGPVVVSGGCRGRLILHDRRRSRALGCHRFGGGRRFGPGRHVLRRWSWHGCIGRPVGRQGGAARFDLAERLTDLHGRPFGGEDLQDSAALGGGDVAVCLVGRH